MSILGDGGLAVVRIKPLAAAGKSTAGAVNRTPTGDVAVEVSACSPSQPSTKKTFTFPTHVFEAAASQESLYYTFMPQRVQAFLDGVNINVMAYGQTGSGKTHTLFGPPGLMARAGSGAFSSDYGKLEDVNPGYGICPRSVIDIFRQLQQRRSSGGGVQYSLTASVVELTAANGNVDMFDKAGLRNVSLDKTANPPRLYGMIEAPMETVQDLQAVFAAIAVRSTGETGLNDTSSRSHCFVFLTLRALDSSGTLRTSRFQFVDLAGNERQKDAHGGGSSTASSTQVAEGMVSNNSLMMLGRCVRELIAAKRSCKAAFSFRNYTFDLVLLLQESLAGTASTLTIMCCSSASANAATSALTLEFGSELSRLEVKPPRTVPGQSMSEARDRAAQALVAGEARAGGMGKSAGKYALIRQGQAHDARNLLAVLDAFQ
jgi:hypothetical protein